MFKIGPESIIFRGSGEFEYFSKSAVGTPALGSATSSENLRSFFIETRFVMMGVTSRISRDLVDFSGRDWFLAVSPISPLPGHTNHYHAWVNRTFRVFQPNLGRMHANTVYVWSNRNFRRIHFLCKKLYPTSRGLKFSKHPENDALRTISAHFSGFTLRVWRSSLVIPGLASFANFRKISVRSL